MARILIRAFVWGWRKATRLNHRLLFWSTVVSVSLEPTEELQRNSWKTSSLLASTDVYSRFTMGLRFLLTARTILARSTTSITTDVQGLQPFSIHVLFSLCSLRAVPLPWPCSLWIISLSLSSLRTVLVSLALLHMPLPAKFCPTFPYEKDTRTTARTFAGSTEARTWRQWRKDIEGSVDDKFEMLDDAPSAEKVV